RLSSLHRYACAYRRAGRDPARNSHRRHRHAVLHLAARRDATDLVMSLAGRVLTIGYSDRGAAPARPSTPALEWPKCRTAIVAGQDAHVIGQIRSSVGRRIAPSFMSTCRSLMCVE